MSMTKSTGNMYPWTTHTHTHLAGKCSHGCSYCYVQAMERRYNSGRYAGDLRLIEKEFDVNYGSGKTIFIEHCNDLFADKVHGGWIGRIIDHCNKWPDNTYVFQTKNPDRYMPWVEVMPPKRLLGCTIETNDWRRLNTIAPDAPEPISRAYAMWKLSNEGERTFITVEPIIDCDPDTLAKWITHIKPEFVNIGADSKGGNLPEPSATDVRKLIRLITEAGIEIREKRNLDRLMNGGER
jgi:DNA repair photolyase